MKVQVCISAARLPQGVKKGELPRDGGTDQSQVFTGIIPRGIVNVLTTFDTVTHMSTIEQRKVRHIELASKSESQIHADVFSQYRLPYRALPEIALCDVDTSVDLLGKTLSQPLIIASMTGGSEHARLINTRLAQAAEKHHVALGVGSQRIALETTEAEATFKIVRHHAPTAVIFANMGAVQLNYGRTIADYQRAIDMIQADGLYLHSNALQEAIQPEGDTNFSGLLQKIETLVKKVSVPVFVKEVGHGIDVSTAKRLIECGVAGIDVAGASGTSWAWIEAQRADNQHFAEWFKDFGLPTDHALEDLRTLTGVSIVASGGIRNPIHALKAHLLGAKYYSAASPFLHAALESETQVDALITRWQKGLAIGLFCIGASNWREAKECALIKEK